MPKRIDKLTDEQKSQIDAWADKWIEIGLRTGEIDLQTFTEGAKEAYGFASIPWHNNVIVVDNPLIMALAAPVAGRSEERRVGKECRSRWSPYH